MPRSLKWDTIYPQLADRVRRQGFIDPSVLDELEFSSLSASEFREAAIDTVEYLARISQQGRRKVCMEEYYLVLQLAESLGICCGLSAHALTDAEKSFAEDELVRMLKPNQEWVRKDLLDHYAVLSAIWPFAALAKRLVYEK
jgi:hypothetical protein